MSPSYPVTDYALGQKGGNFMETLLGRHVLRYFVVEHAVFLGNAKRIHSSTAKSQ
jgi:hypothetical protein